MALFTEGQWRGAVISRTNPFLTGRSYRLKDVATVAGKEDKNKKLKPKLDKPSTAEPAN